MRAILRRRRPPTTVTDKVNYDDVASTYEAGRSAVSQVDDWLSRIDVPGSGEFRVLDLGAGTGIFAREWPKWGASVVIGVDSSVAMLEEAMRQELPDEVRMVGGRAEAIPLMTNSVDLAWLSTVIHHVDDQQACARELARVVVPRGRVLLRGFFAGTSRIDWLSHLPGAERAAARFPSVSEVADLLAEAGFTLTRVSEVTQTARSLSDVRDWIRTMRHADTLLITLTDEEIAGGLQTLDESGRSSFGGALHLVAFTLDQ